MNNLDIYNKLRDMHNILKEIMKLANVMTNSNFELNALDGVDSVLYLAEGIFAKDKELENE